MQDTAKTSGELTRALESTRAHLQGQLRSKEAENNRLAVQIKVSYGLIPYDFPLVRVDVSPFSQYRQCGFLCLYLRRAVNKLFTEACKLIDSVLY